MIQEKKIEIFYSTAYFSIQFSFTWKGKIYAKRNHDQHLYNRKSVHPTTFVQSSYAIVYIY